MMYLFKNVLWLWSIYLVIFAGINLQAQENKGNVATEEKQIDVATKKREPAKVDEQILKQEQDSPEQNNSKTKPTGIPVPPATAISELKPELPYINKVAEIVLQHPTPEVIDAAIVFLKKIKPGKVENQTSRDKFTPEMAIADLPPQLTSLEKLSAIVEKYPTPEVIEVAILFLTKVGASKPQVVSVLVDFAYHKNKVVRNRARKEFLHREPGWAPSLRDLLPISDREKKIKIAKLLSERGKQEIPTFVKLLLSVNPIEHDIAKEHLVGFGINSVLPVLNLLKNHSDKRLDKDILEIMQKLGPQTIPAVVRTLKYAKQHEQQILIDILLSMGKDGMEPALKAFTSDPSPELIAPLQSVLENIGNETIPKIIPLYADPIPTVQKLAQNTIKKFGSAVLPFVINILKTSEELQEQKCALQALETLGEQGRDALSVIRPWIAKKGPLQFLSVRAVRNMDSVAKEAVPELMQAFRSRDWRIRTQAAYALANAKTSSRKLFRVLSTALEQEEYVDVKIAICKAIGHMGADARRAIPRLTALLESYDEALVRAASEALGNIGSKAESAIPELIQVFSMWGPFERDVAAQALAKIGRPALGKLTRTIRLSEYSVTREGAAIALGHMGPKARSAMSALLSALRYDEEIVKIAAARALGKIGKLPNSVIQVLIDTTDSNSSTLRQAIGKVLVQIGRNTLARIIMTLRRSRNEQQRISLIRVLGDIGPEAKNTLPTLIELLGRANLRTKIELIRTFIKMGEKAEKTVPLLLKMLRQESNPRLHGLLSEALIKFGDNYIAQIVQLLDSPKRISQNSATLVLRKFGAAATPYLRTVVNPEAESRLVAKSIEILGEDPANLDILLKALFFNSEIVQESVIEALGKSGDVAVQRLIALLLKNKIPDDYFTPPILDALVSIGRPSVPELVKIVQKPPTLEMQLAVLDAIANIGPDAKIAIVPLIEVLATQQEEQEEIAKCLGKIGEDSIPHLVLLLAKNDEKLQQAVITGLGETKSPKAISYLLKVLEKPQLLSLVIDTLVKMKGIAIPVLEKSLGDPNDYIRFACASAIWEIADPKTIPALQKQFAQESGPMIKHMLYIAIRACTKHKSN